MRQKPTSRSFVRIVGVVGAGLVAGAAPGQAPDQGPDRPAARMLRYPDVSATHIVFVYANDLWLVPRAGGVASPVASPPGLEILPRFSPDGGTIAFQGNYDGNRDIYVLPVTGGVPTRVTHHPATENLCDWTPDGRIIFFQSGLAGLVRQTQLFTVAAQGGLPTRLPMPYAGFGAISPDGRQAAFTLMSTDTRTWKRYRGGMAQDLWLMDLPAGPARAITDWEGTDTLPMWHGSSIYYLSDAGEGHRNNIWSFDTRSGDRAQVTAFTDNDVRWPSIGPGPDGGGEIVFQLGSQLRLLDLRSKQSREVVVTVPGARANLRQRQVEASKWLGSASLSPNAKRVAVEARGEIWSAPAKEGVVRNLTQSDGTAERMPAWSPDGRWIAYFSDASGEYELWIRPSDARPAKKDAKDEKEAKDRKDSGEAKAEGAAAPADAPPAPALVAPAAPRRLTNLGPGFRFSPTWSPDSKHVAFHDNAGRFYLATLPAPDAAPDALADVKTIDTDPWASGPGWVWSHDSNWIAYERRDETSGNVCVWLYNAKSVEKNRVTSPLFDTLNPAFDRAGDFLYVASQRAIADPIYSDLDTSWIYTGTQVLLALPLRKDVKLPWATRSDEEELKADEPKKDDKKDEKKEDKKDEAKPDEAKKNGEDKPAPDAAEKPAPDAGKDDKKDPKKDEKKDEKKELKIDIDGLEARAAVVPVKNGRFGALLVGDGGKILYGRLPIAPGDKASIFIFDPKDEKKEEKLVVAGTGGFDLSADGKRMLISKDGKLQVIDAAAGGGNATDVATGAMPMSIAPRDEWRQIFADVHRIFRDYFYEPTMHGVDWDAQHRHYGAMIDDCVSREDVNYLIAEMISELNVGHAYLTGPGDVDAQPSTPVGMLACDFELAEGHAGLVYRIARIIEGGPWDTDARNPLRNPGSDAEQVKEGEYLLAVNGAPVDATRDPYAAFLGLAGRPTTLTVGPNPTRDASARDVLVTPISIEGEIALRYRAWVEKNRAYVHQKSAGAIGYIYVPNTGIEGQNELVRQFFGVRDRQALLIDERWNGGGQIPTRFVELLNRPVTNYWARRHGSDWPWPPDAHQGPKAMLINGAAGSGGDAFPAYFRRAGLGKLIGRRTWGGLVGISGNPGLIDGGSIAVPTFGYYKTDGTWGIEGHGVDPDIEVIDDPSKMLDGKDPQLDAAIDHLMEQIRSNAYAPPRRPESPNRRGMGIPSQDR